MAALGLVSMMLRCVIVKSVELVDLIKMRKTDSFGETRLVLHVPSFHELESDIITINNADLCHHYLVGSMLHKVY
jgi:hypothetical protein